MAVLQPAHDEAVWQQSNTLVLSCIHLLEALRHAAC
jgi:hypothetical protein